MKSIRCIVAEELEKRHKGRRSFFRAAVFVEGHDGPYEITMGQGDFKLLKDFKVKDNATITDVTINESGKKIDMTDSSKITECSDSIDYDEEAFRQYTEPNIVPISEVLVSKPDGRVSVQGCIQKIYPLDKGRGWKKKTMVLTALDDDRSEIRVNMWNRMAFKTYREGDEITITACEYVISDRHKPSLNSTMSTILTKLKSKKPAPVNDENTRGKKRTAESPQNNRSKQGHSSANQSDASVSVLGNLTNSTVVAQQINIIRKSPRRTYRPRKRKNKKW